MIKKGYKPLHKSLTIKESEIEGLGLFAKENIPKGTDLGISHYHFVDTRIIRTPLGGFYNHSEEPNCIKEESKVDNMLVICLYHLVTLRDIKVGEEITVNYTFKEYEF